MFSNGGQFCLGSNQKKQCELSFYCAVYDAAVLKKPVFQAGISSICVRKLSRKPTEIVPTGGVQLKSL